MSTANRQDLTAVGVIAVKVAVGVCLVKFWMIRLVNVELSFPRYDCIWIVFERN